MDLNLTNSEQINFSINFSAIYELSPPSFVIFNNNEIIYPSTVVNNNYTANFKINLDNNSEYCLKILRENHDEITSQQLELTLLTADGIDLAKILNHSKYFPKYPEPWYTQQKEQGVTLPEYQTGSLVWGWNGYWTFNYTTPFYTWLLNSV